MCEIFFGLWKRLIVTETLHLAFALKTSVLLCEAYPRGYSEIVCACILLYVGATIPLSCVFLHHIRSSWILTDTRQSLLFEVYIYVYIGTLRLYNAAEHVPYFPGDFYGVYTRSSIFVTNRKRNEGLKKNKIKKIVFLYISWAPKRTPL